MSDTEKTGLCPAGPGVLTRDDFSQFKALNVCGGLRPASPRDYPARISRRRLRDYPARISRRRLRVRRGAQKRITSKGSR